MSPPVASLQGANQWPTSPVSPRHRLANGQWCKIVVLDTVWSWIWSPPTQIGKYVLGQYLIVGSYETVLPLPFPTHRTMCPAPPCQSIVSKQALSTRIHLAIHRGSRQYLVQQWPWCGCWQTLVTDGDPHTHTIIKNLNSIDRVSSAGFPGKQDMQRYAKQLPIPMLADHLWVSFLDAGQRGAGWETCHA